MKSVQNSLLRTLLYPSKMVFSLLIPLFMFLSTSVLADNTQYGIALPGDGVFTISRYYGSLAIIPEMKSPLILLFPFINVTSALQIFFRIP